MLGTPKNDFDNLPNGRKGRMLNIMGSKLLNQCVERPVHRHILGCRSQLLKVHRQLIRRSSLSLV